MVVKIIILSLVIFHELHILIHIDVLIYLLQMTRLLSNHLVQKRSIIIYIILILHNMILFNALSTTPCFYITCFLFMKIQILSFNEIITLSVSLKRVQFKKNCMQYNIPLKTQHTYDFLLMVQSSISEKNQ